MIVGERLPPFCGNFRCSAASNQQNICKGGTTHEAETTHLPAAGSTAARRLRQSCRTDGSNGGNKADRCLAGPGCSDGCCRIVGKAGAGRGSQTAAVGGANFALDLLRGAAKPDATTILSPYSALLALGMAANGAGGRTLEEMEYALGARLEDLNAWLASCRAAEDGEVVSANSIWTRNGTVQLLPEFRQTMEQKYGAEVHAGEISAAAINEWVSENTKGRIKKLLEQDNEAIQTYLINAMTFDAEWASPYEPQSCSEGTFHASDGTEQTVTYLSGEERGYLEVAGATGFVKHYSGGRYSFAGLLPAEGSTPEELLEALDGATLLNALCEPQAKKVYTRMPKFTAATTAELKPVLERMGMQAAFTDAADFSLLSDTPLKIDAVQQKTYLQVDESGTIGAAVTSIPMMEATAVQTEEPKTVYLTRPYLCVIFDHETQSIVFLGIVNRVDG